jgi:hypothetical protein
MNIKGLLFGSTAALVAVSGARAADAVVVAEPEPMEYVRVCDTYGVGFYYIPGTETCLRISGLIRYDIDYNDWEDESFTTTTSQIVLRPEGDFVLPPGDFGEGPDLQDLIDAGVDPEDIQVEVVTTTTTTVISSGGLDEGWAKNVKARLNIDARAETEYGTFRRFMRLEGSVNSGSDTAAVNVIYAYMELGGILIGLYDTLYDGDISPEFDSGGGSAAHQIRYTFTGANGISFAVSIEEQDFNLDYTPNVVGRFGLTQAWGGIAIFGAYDATTEEFGVKGIASFNATDAILLELLATYESGNGDFSVNSGWQGKTVANDDGYEASLAGAVSFKASDRLVFRFGGQYFWNAHVNGSDDYKVGGNVDFTVVENLLFRVQVHYNGGDSQDFIDAKARFEGVF